MRRGRAPGPLDGVVLVVAWVALLAATPGALLVMGMPLWTAALVTYGVVGPTLVAGYVGLAGIDRCSVFRVGSRDPWVMGSAALASASLWIALTAALPLIVHAANRIGLDAEAELERIARLVKSLHDSGGAVVLVAVVAVAGPLVEELLFRAILFQGLCGRVPAAWAVVLSSAMFGVAHLNWVQGPLTALVGAHLAFVWWRAEGLGGCFLGHAVHNGAAIGLWLAAGEAAELPLWLGAAAVPLYAAAMAVFVRRTRSGSNRN